MPLGPLLRRLSGRRASHAAPPRPEGPVYAVGDLHGRADLLARALHAVSADAGDAGGATLVLLGDYVDRGPDSAGVLARARALTDGAAGVAGVDRVVALLGNHEAMMLDMLDDPVGLGRRWLRHGGLDTLTSYGVAGLPDRAPPPALREAADALRRAMPEGTEAWLRARPATWRSGDVAFVHAGLDPDRAPGDQPAEVAVWGHPAFRRRPRADGLWVVHGHTIVPEPSARDGRVACDTGAYETGRLTVAALDGGPVRFLAVHG